MRFSLYLHNTVSRREPVFKKQLIITASSSTSYPVLLTPIGINQEQFLISKEKSIILYEVVCKISLSLNLKILKISHVLFLAGYFKWRKSPKDRPNTFATS